MEWGVSTPLLHRPIAPLHESIARRPHRGLDSGADAFEHCGPVVLQQKPHDASVHGVALLPAYPIGDFSSPTLPLALFPVPAGEQVIGLALIVHLVAWLRGN